MTPSHRSSPSTIPTSSEKAITLALSLAQAEKAIHEFAAGQVDAIVDPDGQAYLLRPAQEHLRAGESRLRAILESVGDGIFVVSRGGQIVWQNGPAAQMLGYGPDELRGRDFFDFVEAAGLGHFHRAFFGVVEHFRTDDCVELHLRARDGSTCRIAAMVTLLRDASTNCVVLSCRDATLRRPAPEAATLREAALTAALLDRDRFLAVLAHELRTPLSPILLGIVELEEDPHSPGTGATLAMMRRNLDVQARLISELGDFTTLGQHKVRLQPEPIDAHEAIGFVLQLCASEIAAAQIEVLLHRHAGQSIVVADSVRLQQVMWNLVKNAVKFSTPGSSISIATSNDTDGWLTIEFADHGIGIEKALLPLVFDSFQQGDLSGAQRNDGLGLGLFIAKGLAEAQGGTLTVLSEGRGQGAMFRLTLPSNPRIPPNSH
jgi:two-component system CheB/CheR fusion protein